jgi:CheY-like chemotaxis protein
MEEERERPEIPAGRALLVIDTDPATAVQLREWLEPDVLPVAVETDPDAGLRRARTLRPAAIILDVMSPYGDNWDLVAALNAEPATCEVPVVIASAIENRHFAWALGAQGYIVKPLDRAAVFGALAEIGLVNEPLAAGQPR